MAKRSTLLEQVIRPKKGDLAPAAAKYFLELGFPAKTHTRYRQLSAKAQDGTLSAAERNELQEMLDVDAFLMVLQAKARASLKKQDSAA
jgi:hypothetical protein